MWQKAVLLVGLLCNAFCQANTTADSQSLLIGSFANEQNKGVYLASFDANKNTLVKNKTVAEAINPAYLVWRPSVNILYSVASSANKKQAGVNVFQWQPNKQAFTLLQNIKLNGRGACHLSYNQELQQLAVANYGSGDTYLFQVDKKSHLLTESSHFKNVGNSILRRQRSPHAHYAKWNPSDNNSSFLYVTDLGTDEILVFDTAEQQLALKHRVKLTAGDGPRHLIFHPTLPLVYSLNELSNSITSFTIAQNGNLTRQQHINLLTKKVEKQTASAIRISNDGKFLYAGVRSDNMIYAFNVSDKGELSFLQKISSGGDHPRDFNFSAEQHFILVANMHSNTVNLLWRDKNTGKLTPSDIAINIDSPSYITPF